MRHAEELKAFNINIFNWWLSKLFFGKSALAWQYYSAPFSCLSVKQIAHIYLKERLKELRDKL